MTTYHDLYKEAFDLLKNGQDLNKAEQIFNFLLNKTQTKVDLIFHAASLHMRKGNHGLSILLYNEVLRMDPEFQEAFNNIGVIYKSLNRIEEAKEQFSKCIELENKQETIDPKKMADYYANLGSLYIAQGTPQEALEILNKAVEYNPDFDIAKWNRSLAYLELGDYENGFKEYEFGNRIESTKNRYQALNNIPFWDGTPGQTVAIYGEQGIGDEIMFASILPDAMKDCSIVLDAHPRLADLFRLNHPDIPIYGTRKDAAPQWINFHKIDAKMCMGSLGKFYRKKKEDFPGTPYLKADPQYVEEYKALLNEMGLKPKIGISWKGGTDITNKDYRRIPMDLLLPLLEVDAEFISLQYNPEAVDWVKAFNEKHSKNIYHWKHILDDYDKTAGLVSNLDFIISVPQSVVHLAGALGTPTIQLCPKRGLWQMGVYGEDAPWYSCVKNIWQESDERWEPLIEKAKEELCSYLQKNT